MMLDSNCLPSRAPRKAAPEDVDGEWIEGRIFPGSLLTVRAPAAFFDPLTGCLITEPVKLSNSMMPQPRTFDRKSLQQWWINCAGLDPVSGKPLCGWSIMTSDDDLAAKIRAWAKANAFNLDAVTMAYSNARPPHHPAAADHVVPSLKQPYSPPSVKQPYIAPCSPGGVAPAMDDQLVPLSMGRSMSLPRSFGA